MLHRCDMCGGKKNIIGLGMIEKKCPDCSGVGWIEKEEKVEAQSNKKTREKSKLQKAI